MLAEQLNRDAIALLRELWRTSATQALPRTDVRAITSGNLDAIRDWPPIARFLGWIADKPPDFHAPTRRGLG